MSPGRWIWRCSGSSRAPISYSLVVCSPFSTNKSCMTFGQQLVLNASCHFQSDLILVSFFCTTHHVWFCCAPVLFWSFISSAAAAAAAPAAMATSDRNATSVAISSISLNANLRKETTSTATHQKGERQTCW